MKKDFKLIDFFKKKNVVITIVVSVAVILAIGITIAVTVPKNSGNGESQASTSESEFKSESDYDHIHNFTQVVDKKFLESEATCIQKAVYYYSCVCDAIHS